MKTQNKQQQEKKLSFGNLPEKKINKQNEA